jgi:ATP citrate (pro-S)-lyase
MARKKIREYHGKRLLARHIPTLTKLPADKHPSLPCALISKDTDWKKVEESEEWLSDTPLVVKPDMMFGQRGKHDLVLLNASLQQAKVWI